MHKLTLQLKGRGRGGNVKPEASQNNKHETIKAFRNEKNKNVHQIN